VGSAIDKVTRSTYLPTAGRKTFTVSVGAPKVGARGPGGEAEGGGWGRVPKMWDLHGVFLEVPEGKRRSKGAKKGL